MPETVTDLRQLNLDLTQQERDILFEFTRARQVMEVLQMPGWEHINDLVRSKIDSVQAKYLEIENISPNALWAMHVAQQYLVTFWNATAAQLLTTGDFLKDPGAIDAMLKRISHPEVEDLEGELPNEGNPLPRFPEDRT